jgi:diadenosine tetraphosphate (Ap4A) HIT family hydrolase
MSITDEQAVEIKKQLLAQANNFPEENREQIIGYIGQMNREQLEAFLKQNKIDLKEVPANAQEKGCIFCSIAKGTISSYKLDENKKAIAALEINPLSRGHSIVIPLEHEAIEKIPKSALSLAQKIAKKIKTKLKPEDIKIETTTIQGHALINIIPIYKNEKLGKKQANEKELKEIQNKIEIKKRASRKEQKKNEKQESEPKNNIPKISFRIP